MSENLKYTQEEYASIKRRAVDNLLRLNTIIIGLAIIEAVKQLLTETKTGDNITFSIKWELGFPVIMLMLTMVVFYHGANRYLDNAYVFEKKDAKKGTAIIDLFVFFGEAALFYLMALTVSDFSTFIFWFLILLAVDVLWLGTVYLKNTEAIFKGVSPWMYLNLITFFAMGAVYWLSESPNRWNYLFALGTLRSIIDYIWNWKFYFPVNPKLETEE